MLDARTQSYLELSWVAGTLALRLDRVASGKPEEDDEEAIKDAADVFNRLLSEVKVPVDSATHAFPLFTTAEGLDVTLSAIKPTQLKEIANELLEVSKALCSGSFGQTDAKERAMKLRDLFLRVERQAGARAAMSRMGHSDLSRIYSYAEGK